MGGGGTVTDKGVGSGRYAAMPREVSAAIDV
jgi:hypothetical protein